MTLTNGNKKETSFFLRCASTGLLMADASSGFEVLVVTYRPDLAFQFPCEDAAKHSRSIVCALYGSFDWQVVKG